MNLYKVPLPSNPVYQTCYQRFSQRCDQLSPSLFPFILKQDGSVSLVMWHIRILDMITIELPVHR